MQLEEVVSFLSRSKLIFIQIMAIVGREAWSNLVIRVHWIPSVHLFRRKFLIELQFWQLFNQIHISTYLSLPIAMFVKMLTATLVTCMKSTIGHIATPNTQCPSIDLVKLNGIQKQAMKRSAMAMFSRNLVKSVFDLFPHVRTTKTRAFPHTERAVVIE